MKWALRIGLALVLLVLTSCTSKSASTPTPSGHGVKPSATGSRPPTAAASSIVLGTSDPYCLHGPIYLVSPDGSGHTRIGEGSSPAWSPDGTHLVFVASPPGKKCSSVGSLLLADSTGHVLQTLVRRAGATVSPAWSPDGRQILYWAGGQIHVINADGTGGQVIKTPVVGGLKAYLLDNPPLGGTNAGWSPDGKRIIVLYPSGTPYTNAYFLIDPTSSEATGSKPDTAKVDGFAWSPDGTALLLMVCPQEHSSCQVVKVDMNTGHAGPLGPQADWFGSPAYSPDGKLVALLSYHRGLNVISSNGENLQAIPGTGNVAWTAWSPDGRQLLFVRAERRHGQAESRVGVVDVNTMTARWITPPLPGGEYASTAAWQPAS